MDPAQTAPHPLYRDKKRSSPGRAKCGQRRTRLLSTNQSPLPPSFGSPHQPMIVGRGWCSSPPLPPHMASRSQPASSFSSSSFVPRDGSGSHPSSNRESTSTSKSTSTSENGRRHHHHNNTRQRQHHLPPFKPRHLERYYARQNVTSRRPLAMGQVKELDPLWQDLDWYVRLVPIPFPFPSDSTRPPPHLIAESRTWPLVLFFTSFHLRHHIWE